MTRRYMTDQDAKDIRRLAGQGLTASQIGREISVDYRRVGEWANRIGVSIRRIKACGVTPGPWTVGEIETLRRRYPDEPTHVIAADLGRSVRATLLRASIIGVTKSPAFHQSEHTGRRRANGSAVYMRDGRWRVSRGILERRVNGSKWRTATLSVWRDHNGPPPAGMVAVWRSGMATTDPDKATIDRIELISRAELMQRNSLHNRYPPEVVAIMRMTGAIKHKIKKLEEQTK